MVSLSFVSLLPACYQIGEEEEVVLNKSSKLSIVTRSSSNTSIEYPLTIYAFAENGTCKATAVAESADEAVALNLAGGSYRITAVAGYSDFDVSENISATAAIATKTGNVAQSALMMGSADVQMSGSSTVSLQMALKVASMEVSLQGLPDDVTEVTVSFANEYSKMLLDGTYSDGTKTTKACVKDEDRWTTGRFYILPSADDETVVSIAVNDGTETQTYGYTYSAKFKAGIPYSLNGTFAQGFSLTGNIVANNWDKEQVLDFNFGPNVNEQSGNGNDNHEDETYETATLETAELPQQCSIWNGHLVALVENQDETGADVLLVSLMDYKDVCSAYSATNPDEAKTIAASYIEMDLTDWHIPTKDEAAKLKSEYTNNLAAINALLETAGGEMLRDKTDDDRSIRYLCDEARKTYSYKPTSTGQSSSITQAGAKVKYQLRLVKAVHLQLPAAE